MTQTLGALLTLSGPLLGRGCSEALLHHCPPGYRSWGLGEHHLGSLGEHHLGGCLGSLVGVSDAVSPAPPGDGVWVDPLLLLTLEAAERATPVCLLMETAGATPTELPQFHRLADGC